MVNKYAHFEFAILMFDIFIQSLIITMYVLYQELHIYIYVRIEEFSSLYLHYVIVQWWINYLIVKMNEYIGSMSRVKKN